MSSVEYLKKNIKRMREEKGWYQEELANKLGVTQRAVSSWESGQAYPRIGALEKMCKLFDCRLSDLTAGSNHDYIIKQGSTEILIETQKTDLVKERLLKIYGIMDETQKKKLLKSATEILAEEE